MVTRYTYRDVPRPVEASIHIEVSILRIFISVPVSFNEIIIYVINIFVTPIRYTITKKRFVQSKDYIMSMEVTFILEHQSIFLRYESIF